MYKQWARAVVTMVLAATVASGAQAELIQRDLTTGAGDGGVVFDTASGLEWLNLQRTDGWSFNQIEAGQGGWISTQGFRFATRAELHDLIVSVGVAPNTAYDGRPGTVGYAAAKAIKDLAILLGINFVYEDQGSPVQSRWAQGYLGDPYSTSPGYLDFAIYGSLHYYQDGDRIAAIARDGIDTQVYRTGMYGEMASFLVREAAVQVVPTPASAPLVVTGLLALAAAVRRRPRKQNANLVFSQTTDTIRPGGA